MAEPGTTVVESSVPVPDRSRALTDYPAELLSNPPQVLEAEIHFRQEGSPPVTATTGTSPSLPGQTPGTRSSITASRNAFTELLTTPQLSPGMVCLALAVALGLGALHALEPGHGKTVVAAYLVGTRGTPRHALYLGLIVTATHTAGVYLLGAVTLYLSHYVVPERLYPWLGGISGLLITGLGCGLLLRRYGSESQAHTHIHSHAHHPSHLHKHAHAHHHETIHHDHPSLHEASQAQSPDEETISCGALLALGVTGGIVPCPAALVVLLSAIALQRVGFGLLLIVAFSVGLASVLITLGLFDGVYPAGYRPSPRGEAAHDPLVAVDLSGCDHCVWPGNDSPGMCDIWDGAATALSDSDLNPFNGLQVVPWPLSSLQCQSPR